MRILAAVAGSLLAGLALIRQVEAQRVSADVVVRGGPIAGHVRLGDGYGASRRPVIVRRPIARRIVVLEHARFHSRRQWLRHGYRPVTRYLVEGRYYDRMLDDERRPVHEVVVYEREGRFYREGDGRDRDYRQVNHDCDDDRHSDAGR